MPTEISVDKSKLILNGLVISGYSDDEDVISLPDSEEQYIYKKGADGGVSFGSTGTKGGELTIKLQANSKSVQILQSFALAIRNGGHVKFQGLLSYSNGSQVVLTDGFLTKYPLGHTIGKGAPKTMVYVIMFSGMNFETITGAYD